MFGLHEADKQVCHRQRVRQILANESQPGKHPGDATNQISS